MTETASFFGGNIFLSCARVNLLSSNLGMIGLPQLTIQQSLMHFMFYFGSATASYWFLRGFRRGMNDAKDYLRSLFNGSKYTNSVIYESLSKPSPSMKNQDGSKHYYAGFNLILIDRDMEILKKIEDQLRQELVSKDKAKVKGNQNSKVVEDSNFDRLDIFKIAILKFDPSSLQEALIPVKEMPVKIFVNCKNSKRSSPKDKNENDVLRKHQKGDELLTRNEVYFSGRENIEGFSTLVSIFLYQMRRDSDYPSVINVDNYTPLNLDKIRNGQILFEASIAFQDRFTNLLQHKFKDVRSINVKVDFKDLKDNEKLQKKLCQNSFSYLGIKDAIQI